jgi:ABC-type glutathione transport system ATPase component
MPVLSVRGLSIDYLTRRGPLHAVREVSFDIERGEAVAIIGESGSGKTTLAMGLIRLSPAGTRVTGGEVHYFPRPRPRLGRAAEERGPVDVLRLPPDALREFRWSECAMVFQAALSAFNPVITIWEQFLDTGRAHGLRDATASPAAATATQSRSRRSRSATSTARSRTWRG